MRNILLSLLMSFPAITLATFDDGIDAFIRGDYLKAAREWQPLADLGDPDATRNLARLYHQGLGVKIDLLKARHLYQLAAAKCNAAAQNNLGLMMLNGQGGAKDLVGAFRLFEKAAVQGLHSDAEAMGNLAGMYLTGTGTQANIIEAYKWYILNREYTTDFKNKQLLLPQIAQVENIITPTQKLEAMKCVNSFQKSRCLP